MRRPVENAETQRLFQLLHPLADDRWPRAKLGSGFGEALALGDPDERVELVQVPEHRSHRHLSIHQSLISPPGRRGRFRNNSCSKNLATNQSRLNVKCLFNLRNTDSKSVPGSWRDTPCSRNTTTTISFVGRATSGRRSS